MGLAGADEEASLGPNVVGPFVVCSPTSPGPSSLIPTFLSPRDLLVQRPTFAGAAERQGHALVLLVLVPHIHRAHSWTDQDYRVRFHALDTNHGEVASRWAYLARSHLLACRLTKQLGPVRQGVDMRLQVSLLPFQELLVQIPRVEGQEESPAGTAGRLVEEEASIVPDRYQVLV